MFRKFSISILVVFISLLWACKKKSKTVEDNIPYQTVDIKIYPNDPIYNPASNHAGLSQIGGWAYINGGVNGIIVYRLNNTSSADFVAIERTSTALPDNPAAAVKVQSDNYTLKDTVSGYKWGIVNGAPLSGNPSGKLRLYTTTYDNGSGTLYIKN